MFLEQYQCFWKFWFGLVVHWLLGLEFVYSFWSPFSSQEMSYLDYSTIDYNVELNNETSLEMRPESMYRNITTSTKMVLQAEPTDLRRNVYYYQIYYVYLNTIFASILPLLFLLYFNINTAKVRRLLERFAEHFPCCILANQQYSSIIFHTDLYLEKGAWKYCWIVGNKLLLWYIIPPFLQTISWLNLDWMITAWFLRGALKLEIHKYILTFTYATLTQRCKSQSLST